MAESPSPAAPTLLSLTAQIVAAHVSGNTVPAESLPDLILRVHGALANAGIEPAAEPAPQQQPAVSVKKSIQPDYLVCLEDGAKVTMLKRYLRRRFGLEPDEYRAKWGLPPDYPMVAPNYAARRSTLAKELGLGRKRQMTDSLATVEDDMAPDETPEETEVEAGGEEKLYTADMRDEATAKHTAESVFGNFRKIEEPEDEEASAEATAGAAPGPKKRGRKPFSQQSMRTTRTRRTPA